MNAESIAAAALLQVRTGLDNNVPGNHRADALGALLALMSERPGIEWIPVAVAELWRGRQTRAELRACVDECLGLAHAASLTGAPRRTTILPPPSGDKSEMRLEKEAAERASLASVDLAVNVLGLSEVVPAYSTVPASAGWMNAAEMQAAG